MLKSLKFVFINLIIVICLAGCKNFLTGSALKNELEEKIEYANNQNPLAIVQATPVFQQGGVPQNTPIKILFNHGINTSTFEYSVTDDNGKDYSSYYDLPVFSVDKKTVYIYYKDVEKHIIENNTLNLSVSISNKLRDLNNKKFTYNDYKWYFSINSTIDNTAASFDICNFTQAGKLNSENKNTEFKTANFKNYDLTFDENELSSANIMNYAYARDLLIYIEGSSETSSIESITVKETLVNYSDGTAVKNAKSIEKVYNKNDADCVYALSKNNKDSFLIAYSLKSVTDGAVKFDIYLTAGNGSISSSKSFKIIKFSTLSIEDIKVTNEPNVTYDTWDFEYATKDPDIDELKTREKTALLSRYVADICNLRWTVTSSTVYKNIPLPVDAFDSSLEYGKDIHSLTPMIVEKFDDTYMHAYLPYSSDPYDAVFTTEECPTGLFNIGLPRDGAIALLTITLKELGVNATKSIYFPPQPIERHSFTDSNGNYRYIYMEQAFTPDNKALSTILFTRKSGYNGFDIIHMAGIKSSGVVYANEKGIPYPYNNTCGLIDTDGDGKFDCFDSDNTIYAGWDSRQMVSYRTEDGIYGPFCDFFEVEPNFTSAKTISSFKVNNVSYEQRNDNKDCNNLIDLNVEVSHSAQELGSMFSVRETAFQYSYIRVYMTPDKDNYDLSNLAGFTLISDLSDENEGKTNRDSKKASITIDSAKWWNQYMIIETCTSGWCSPIGVCSNKCVLEPLSKGGRRIVFDDPGITEPVDTLQTGKNSSIGQTVTRRDLNTGKIVIEIQAISNEYAIDRVDYMLSLQRNKILSDSYYETAVYDSNTAGSITNMPSYSEFTYSIEFEELEKANYTLLSRVYNNNDYSFYSYPNIICDKSIQIENKIASYYKAASTVLETDTQVVLNNTYIDVESISDGKSLRLKKGTAFTIPAGTIVNVTGKDTFIIPSDATILLSPGTSVSRQWLYSYSLDRQQIASTTSDTDVTLVNKDKWELIFHDFTDNGWTNKRSSGLLDSDTYNISSNLTSDSYISVQLSIQKEMYNQIGQRKIFYNGTPCTRGECFKVFEDDSKTNYMVLSDKPVLVRVLQSGVDCGNDISEWEEYFTSVVTEFLTNTDGYTNDAFSITYDSIKKDNYYCVVAHYADNRVEIIQKGKK